MALVEQEEIKKVVGLSKYGKIGDWTSYCLMHISRINRLNKIYKKIEHLSGSDFLNAVIKEFNLKYEIDCEDLKRIPKVGSFVTVSNHPLGALDGILLIKIISKIRPDYKILANFLLERVKPIKSYIFPVNPFEYYNKSSISVIKKALKYVKKGYCLGMFPAGEVSCIQKKSGKICDRKWQESAIKFIIKTNCPVIPIYFHGKNSKIFYKIGKYNEYLRTAMLPFEMFSQKGKIIKVRIGNPIFNKKYKNIKEYSNFLRKKTYIFSNIYNNIKKYKFCFFNKKINKISPPINKELLQNDISKLNSNNLIINNYKYQMFFAKAELIPNILKEIARLRELSFREVGQGTNKSIDLDKYDEYYHHLFLWEKNKNKVIGAYRIGFGKEIFEKKGIKGFYLTNFFSFEKKIFFLFKNSLEMGRAFLIKEYQKKTLPLFLLWKGIIKIILIYPEYNYLIGSVGISKDLSDFSISLIVEFIKLYFYDHYLSKYVHPKNEYKVKEYSDKKFILNESKNDLDKFDKLIDEIEPGKIKLPILIKKYIKQNAKIISFNVDKEFNNSTDGLMYIKRSDLFNLLKKLSV